MKQNDLSSMILKLNELLLECNTLMCNNDTMGKAGKDDGFNFLKIKSDKYENGYYYAVRYKDLETKKWIPTKTSTETDNETLARAFAIKNREEIIKKYKEHAKELHQKNDGKEFYKMLEDYYTTDSKYLEDDRINNKRMIDKKQRGKNISFIERYLIPYFKDAKITSIQKVNRSVYSGLKLYLQNVKNEKGESLATKTINNYLIAFNRILQYYERNEKITRLPYSIGTGIIKITKREKANSKKAHPLPTDNLKGIFENYITTTEGRKSNLLYYTLSLIGLTTGMRDSEIGRIKFTDIIHVKDDNYFYLKAYNHKTEYHNVEDTDEYRKIPLHPFVVGMLKHYIDEKKIGKDDYLFGIPKLNEDTKQIDGNLHYSKTHKAIIFLYRNIKFRENLNDKGEVEIPSTEELEKEMNEKRIVFYSLRHTFNTLCVLYRHNDTDTTRSDNIIDYFMGHKMASKMMENYTHINKVDNHTFYHNYGKFVIDMLDKFIFTTKEEQKKNEALETYAEIFLETRKEYLLNKDGKVDYEKGMKVLKEMIDTMKPEKLFENDDDFFTSV
jgi:integrase